VRVVTGGGILSHPYEGRIILDNIFIHNTIHYKGNVKKEKARHVEL
jgi:hypothetical protein